MPRPHRPRNAATEPLEPRTLLSYGGGTLILNPGFPSTPLPPLTDLTAANNQLLFINDDGTRGRELWRSDGTAAGSSLLKDINPGAADAFPTSVPGLFAFPAGQSLLPVGAITYFTATDPDHGLELWKTNGTPAGTTLVKDFTPGVGNSHYANFTNVNGRLYFTTAIDTHQYLWKTDGTSAGTVQLADLTTNFIQSIIPVGDTAFLLRSTSDTTHPYQLWKTSPAAPALARVTLPDDLTLDYTNPPMLAGGKLFFYDPKVPKLWRLDPATSTFSVVKDFTEFDSSYEVILTPVAAAADGKLYFTRFIDTHRHSRKDTFDLWVTDGTSAGTRALFTGTYDPYGNLLGATNFRTVGNTLYFSAPLGNSRFDLWRSDGTTAGTQKVAALGASAADHFVTLGPSLFFTDETALWRSDGTAQGTATVAGLPDGRIVDFTTVGMQIFLRAQSINTRDNPATNEFWAFNTQSPRRRFRLVSIPLTPDVRLRGGILQVRGLDEADTITVTADPAAGTVTVDWNGVPSVYPLAAVSGVVVDGSAGSDALTLVGPVPRATLLGGYGSDTLVGGDNDDQLHGDYPSLVQSIGSDVVSYDDLLRGGAGDDDLFGEAGSDTLDGGAGADVLSGGASTRGDTADYSARTRPVAVTLDRRNRDGERYERDNVLPDIEILLGGSSDDYLDASGHAPAGDYPYYAFTVTNLRGNDGNDTLIGSDGNDILDGGAGNDFLSGRGGADTLYGEDGDDTLYGDAGLDSLLGGPGADRAPRDPEDVRSDVEAVLRRP